MTECPSESEIRAVMKSDAIKKQIQEINTCNAELERKTGKKYAELEVLDDGRLRVFRRRE